MLSPAVACAICRHLPATPGSTACAKCRDLSAEIELARLASAQRQLVFRRTDVVAYL